MMLIRRVIIVLIVLPLTEESVYLSNTEDSSSLQFYDCVYHENSNYCRRPSGSITLRRNDATWKCHHGGESHPFVSLWLNNTSVSTILHTWRSSTEMAEEYSHYLIQKPKSTNTKYLCKCNNPQSFGKNCEYLLPMGTTFKDTAIWEIEMKQMHRDPVQMYGDIVCYTTLICDSGLLCLDWRDICDGVQQCMFGYDEENCDKLEFNECEDDEYRCMNGMCIPDEYFLDGDYDCMDMTDEKGAFDDMACTFSQANLDCDDRMCLSIYWSCGDGQCIYDRLAFQKELSTTDQCNSKRDQYYMCETHSHSRQWTLPNGRCYTSEDYADPTLQNQSVHEKCVYFAKCALSDGLEKNCSCKNDESCTNQLKNPCEHSTIQYPNGRIIAPYIVQWYTMTNKNWFLGKPKFIITNATIKCRGYMINQLFQELNLSTLHLGGLENLLCNSVSNNSVHAMDRGYDKFCYNNDSRTFNNHSYYFIDVCTDSRECISPYRVGDGYGNCYNSLDEAQYGIVSKTCSNVKRHRFRCSAEQPTCLTVNNLGDLATDCENSHDEYSAGVETMLFAMHCNRASKSDCKFIRQYIEKSWNIDYNSTTELKSSKTISFRAYCDTFWNFGSKIDENITMCHDWWKCPEEQWRCRSGQCIKAEWILDGEWDCTDASDEEGIFISENHLSPHNLKIIDTSMIEDKFKELYIDQPFYTICDARTEFPCFRINSSDPLCNVTYNRPCISLEKIGNNVVDCIGGLDERNTLEYCKTITMLGRNIKCSTSDTCIPYARICDDRCPNKSDDAILCYDEKKLPECSEPATDFTCLDGECAKNGWCDDEQDCFYGEDEYLCDVNLDQSAQELYRTTKERDVTYNEKTFRLPRFPVPTSRPKRNTPTMSVSSDLEFSNISYVCNRGIGVFMYNDSVVCFCPSHYYGDKCQFHSDRVTIIVHLNFSQSVYAETSNSAIVLKFIVLLLLEDQTLTSYEFHARPAVEMTVPSKKIDHVLYSRINETVREKQARYFNRSNIINEHPYSIRIEAYDIKIDERAELTAVWQYPVYFDYLPNFRFAKVLRLTKPEINENPCSSNPCPHHNQKCHQLLNQNSSYVCLCSSNYRGENCSILDQMCSEEFCSPHALCKPTYRGLITADELPYCICPIGKFGLRCELEHDQCKSNPCRNNGTCFPSSTPARYFCSCNSFYHGDQCHLAKEGVILDIDESVKHRGAVVQYFDIDFSSLNLVLVHQKSYDNLPYSLSYWYGAQSAPEIITVKLYDNNDDTQIGIYLISVHINAKTINGRTQVNEKTRCIDVQALFQKGEDISPFKYHRLCILNNSLLCFFDADYLCICDENHSRAECFGYDHTLDHCSHCRSGGRCLKGGRSQEEMYICVCPQCFSGRSCEFNSQSFSFTFDQLFSADLLSENPTGKRTIFYSLIIGPWIVFLLGLMNNICSFTTFRRPRCRRKGVGQYLLCMSIVNQINLGFLACRLTHLTINISNDRLSPLLDIIFCKFFNYSLTASSRITYWLVSLIAFERTYITLFLGGQWLQRPYIARRLILVTSIGILITGSYELVFVTSHSGFNHGTRAICVLDFPSRDPVWIYVHQAITVTNSLLPFIINICCMITIICIVIKKKMNVNTREIYTPMPIIATIVSPTSGEEVQVVNEDCQDHKITQQFVIKHTNRFQLLGEVLSENKELVIGPAFTLVPQLFSLPLFIASIVLTCQNIETNPLRYLLITSCFTSFIPQLISFFLYISPSSFYSKEWSSTNMNKRIAALKRCNRQIPSTTSALFSTVNYKSKERMETIRK